MCQNNVGLVLDKCALWCTMVACTVNTKIYKQIYLKKEPLITSVLHMPLFNYCSKPKNKNLCPKLSTSYFTQPKEDTC